MSNSKDFSLGGQDVPAGSMVRGLLPLTQRMDGSTLGIPYIVINGAADGPNLLIDGGTHGDEVEGIMAVQQVAKSVTPEELRGTLILVPALNYLATEAMIRVTPKTFIGDPGPTDVNRSFPGKPDGSTTQRIAHLYGTEVISRANYMVSCHGGNNSMMVGRKVLFEYDDSEWGQANWALAEALGFEIMCTQLGYAGTSMATAKGLNIPCIVPECGGADRGSGTHRQSVQYILDGLLNVCRSLDMLDGEVVRPERFRRADINEHVHAARDGFVVYEDGFDLGQEVVKGQRVGTLLDVYGDAQQDLVSEWDGVITLIRRHPVVRNGDWICSVTLETVT